MQSINVYEKGIGYLSACISYYAGAGAYVMLFILGLLFILLRGDEREKRIFLVPSMFLLLTVYNPIAPVILDKFFDVNSEYYRFFWIAPVVILVPYLAVKLLMNRYEMKDKVVIIVLLALIMLTSGKSVFRGGIQWADNIYKMPDELIKISEIIHADSDKEYTKAFLEYEYNMQMRQYDPKILLTIDREDYLYATSSNYSDEQLANPDYPQYKLLAALARYQQVSKEDFLNALEVTHTEYIVVNKNHLMMPFIKELELETVAETDNHVVLKYKLLEPYEFELVDYSVVY